MKKPIMSKRGRQFDEGGDVEAKMAGLEASNKEKPMGFFERLRAGNIDDPESEAYKRLGAGRGRAERIPVEDVTPTPKINNKSEGMGPFNQRLQAAKDAEQPNRNKTYETGLLADYSGVNKAMPQFESAAEDMLNSTDIGSFNEGKKFDKYLPTDAGSSLGSLSPYTAKKKLTDKPALEKTTSSENKTRGVDEASSTKKMEEDMRNYKPRYTPPGSVPKTTTQKHPPKVSIPERPDNSFPGSKYKLGGSVSKASSRADGIAQRGKTRGVMR